MLANDNTNSESPISLRERQKLAQEEAILAAAHALMVEKGFEATTMDDIAAHAHISKPTLYARFPNKEEIAVRAIVGRCHEGIAFIRSLPVDKSPTERLKMILNRILTRKFLSNTGTFAVQQAALTPQVRAHPEYRKYSGEIISLMMEIVEEGQRDGSFAPERNARMVAQAMFSFVRDPEVSELISTGVVPGEAAIQTITDIILRGIEKR